MDIKMAMRTATAMDMTMATKWVMKKVNLTDIKVAVTMGIAPGTRKAKVKVMARDITMVLSAVRAAQVGASFFDSLSV